MIWYPLSDDAFYYLQIAFNIAKFGRSTFDNAFLTNGYQPIWQLVVTILAYFSDDKLDLLLKLKTVQIVFFLFDIVILFFLARTLGGVRYFVPLLAGILLYCTQTGNWLNGMESVALLPVLLLFILFFLKKGFPETRTEAAYYGVFFVIICFLRLDAAALLVSFLVALTAVSMRRPDFVASIGRAIIMMVPALACLALYFAFNYAYFGYLVPISGLAKQLGGNKFGNYAIAFSYFFSSWFFLPSIILAMYLSVTNAFRLYSGRPTCRCEILIVIFAFSILLQCLYYGSSTNWGIWGWYLYLYAGLFVLGAVWIYDWAGSIRSLGAGQLREFAFLMLAMLIAAKNIHTLYGFSKSTTMDNFESADIAIAEFFNANRSMQDDRHFLAMGDRAGVLGYFLNDRRFHLVQLEGLVAGKPYIEALENGSAPAWLRSLPLEYLIVSSEIIPEFETDGHRFAVVVEPVQTRRFSSARLYLCIPEERRIFGLGHSGSEEARVYDVRNLDISCPADERARLDQIRDLKRTLMPSEFKQYRYYIVEEYVRSLFSKGLQADLTGSH